MRLGKGIAAASAVLMVGVGFAAHASTVDTQDAPPPPRCDPIDPTACLLPFPDNFYTVPDPASATGRRVDFQPSAMPVNITGQGIDPTEWNRNDGFSPGSAILTYVPGLDLGATWDRSAPITDPDLSLASDSPVVVLDAATGERQAVWTEVDRRPNVPDDRRLLIMHPAKDFATGHTFVVALRNLKASDRTTIPAGAAFARLRDGVTHRASTDRDLAILRNAGIDTSSLYLAWDFTVASDTNLTERALHIRDDALAAIGEGSPPYVITEVTQPTDDPTTARRVEGTLLVPNYLTPAGTSFYTVGSQDGLPRRDSAAPDLEVPFVCDIPKGASLVSPSHPLLYGHGLLGTRDEVNGPSGTQLRRHNFTTCATDWIGFASADETAFRTALVDLSTFPGIIDRAQQGFVNFIALGRALSAPGGLTTDPAFGLMVKSGELFYDGNSQGGTMGGALTALDPDFRNAVLGVPGMNWSLMLDRSVDWYGSLFRTFSGSYTDPLTQEIAIDLMQMLWDRAEVDGYATHVTHDPLPGTPSHQVLLQVAYGDHQTNNVATEVLGRTIGAQVREPALRHGLDWLLDPLFGFTQSAHDAYLVYWFDPTVGDAAPPQVNAPDVSGADPHDFPRRDLSAGDQAAAFLLTGKLVDTCGRRPCITTASSRD